MSISREDIKYTAKLARLEFNEYEETKLIEYFNHILKYISQLDKLDVEKEDVLVNPYEMENRFREDIVEQSLKPNVVMKNSPRHSENYILVPKIMD